MPKLAGYVHVRDQYGAPHTFGPTDEVPSWAAEQIRNPAAWAQESAEAAEVEGASAPDAEETPAPKPARRTRKTESSDE